MYFENTPIVVTYLSTLHKIVTNVYALFLEMTAVGQHMPILPVKGQPQEEYTCPICGYKSNDKHCFHYGGVSCYSCRAFFRRAHQVSFNLMHKNLLQSVVRSTNSLVSQIFVNS